MEKVNALSPIQAGQAENLLNLTLYWGLSGSGHARRSALRYLSGLMRLPLAREDDLPDAFADQAEMLQGFRESLLQKGFPVLRSFPYLFKVMADNGVKEEDVVR